MIAALILIGTIILAVLFYRFVVKPGRKLADENTEILEKYYSKKPKK